MHNILDDDLLCVIIEVSYLPPSPFPFPLSPSLRRTREKTKEEWISSTRRLHVQTIEHQYASREKFQINMTSVCVCVYHILIVCDRVYILYSVVVSVGMCVWVVSSFQSTHSAVPVVCHGVVVMCRSERGGDVLFALWNSTHHLQ